MEKYIDPYKMDVSDKPVVKDGFIYKLKKPDGSDFSESDLLSGPVLIVSEKMAS